MAEKGRNFSVFLLVMSLIGATIFYGCGSATSDPVPAIQYSITGSYNSEAFAASPSTRGSLVPGISLGILIYSESDPTNYADVDTANNRYQINNLRPGSHHIVFKHLSGLESYIARSLRPVVLTEAAPVKECDEQIKAKKCTKTLSGKLLNSSGAVITPAPTLSLWGQEIEVNPSTGEFKTPPMPEGEEADLVVKAVNYQETKTRIVFQENPAYYEITAVDTSSNNLPPTVTLSSRESTYHVSSQIAFTAEGADPDNDRLIFDWRIESCNHPAVAAGTQLEGEPRGPNKSVCYWDSPDESCIATISVTVKDREDGNPEKLVSKAMLRVQIGTGIYHPNTEPVVSGISIEPYSASGDYYGNRTYTITLDVSDADGDSPNCNLSISPSGGKLNRRGSNIWTWKTPDLAENKDYSLHFKVSDKKHTVYHTEYLAIKATKPNNNPVLISRMPADGDVPTIMSGKPLELLIVADDEEKENLTISWSCDYGEIKKTSQNGYTASATWIAPIINADDTKEVVVRIEDASGGFITETFTINVIPDPDMTAPVPEISITGTPSTYNGTIPLFKVGETATFTGTAIDKDSEPIVVDAFYTWNLIRPDGNIVRLKDGSKTATFVANSQMEAGDYRVVLWVRDTDNIRGEEIKDFRVNILPIAEIICNGKEIGSDGRMTPPTAQTYFFGVKEYDVFNVGDPITLVASCTDIETPVAALVSGSKWKFKTNENVGGTYNFETAAEAGVLNTVSLSTTDSKGEASIPYEYSFFVNKAPVFEVATSTKTGFIDTDTITLDAKVSDDDKNIKMEWFFAKKIGSTWSNYTSYNLPGSNPVTSASNQLTSKIMVKVSTFLEALGVTGGDFKFRLIATDSMNVATVNDDIHFSITEPHVLTNMTVASGTYSDSGIYTTFEALPVAATPVVFPAKTPFSIKSGSNKWVDDMTWTWYDIYWTNGNPGAPAVIGASFVDGYKLNGYKIDNNFGTHTIRLEGKYNELGIVASTSVDIFINSTPEISFANMGGGIARFDTDDNATFTLTLKEDNPNERLGITWTIQKLDEDLNPFGTAVVCVSHDLDPSTGNISSVSMNNSNQTNVIVTWDKMEGAPPLASGALRVQACAYDAYGAAATATVDLLINRLPTFKNVGSTDQKLFIKVPDQSDNPEAECYEYFTNQPYTMIGTAPAFLVNQPSMYLKFEINASDYELEQSGLDLNTYPLTKDHIVWSFSEGAEIDHASAIHSPHSSVQGARFKIGLNTVNVEIRDSFYGRYGGRFNSLSIATYSANFHVWESQSHDLSEDYYSATNIFPSSEQSIFYVQYERVATYTEAFQIKQKNKYLSWLLPGYIDTNASLYTKEIDANGQATFKEADPKKFLYTDAGLGSELPRVIAVMGFDNGKIGMLTNSIMKTIPDLYVKYMRPPSFSEPDYGSLFNYSFISVESLSQEDNRNNVWSYGYASATQLYDYPGEDIGYMGKVFAMSERTMLLKGWKPSPSAAPVDAMALIGSENRCYLNETNAATLYSFDGKNLSFDANYSKVRYLSRLTKLDHKLFVTDTGNDRVLRLSNDHSSPSKIDVKEPIDIAMTDSKYLFTLSRAGATSDEGLVRLFNIDNASATLACEPFAQLINSIPAGVNTNLKRAAYRAGKLFDPRAMYFYSQNIDGDIYGGLVILERGSDLSKPKSNRIQIIRTNMRDWIE